MSHITVKLNSGMSIGKRDKPECNFIEGDPLYTIELFKEGRKET